MSGGRRPANVDHVGGRITHHQTEPPTSRPAAHNPDEWTRFIQSGDVWLEHNPCRRTFLPSVDQAAHERTCHD